MTVKFDNFELKTKAYFELIDITPQVKDGIRNSKLRDGIVNVHVAGSTGAISTIEFEPGLVQHDVEAFLEKIVPYNANYKHHRTWGDHNGAGHLRSFLLKTSQTFPFRNKELLLGTWQQIVFLENDEKSRRRKIYLTIIGE